MKPILSLLLALISLQNIFCEEPSDSIKKDLAFEIRFVEKTETDLIFDIIFKNKGKKEIVIFNTDNISNNIMSTCYTYNDPKKPESDRIGGGGSGGSATIKKNEKILIQKVTLKNGEGFLKTLSIKNINISGKCSFTLKIEQILSHTPKVEDAVVLNLEAETQFEIPEAVSK